ncbi:MAG: hypothetical protein PWQ97_435 [Tepidanaerobacteraceae bacterium]|nr:hypothetical protein [Tepidanaerobacteraceae bacterium]
MSDFGNYIKELLRGILRQGKDSEIDKLADAVGINQDELKKIIFHIRRAWNVATAIGPELDAHGEDRKMPRYAGEDDETYRNRLLAAYIIYSEGGTNPGIIHALNILGFTDVDIYELYKDTSYIPRFDGTFMYNNVKTHSGEYKWAQFDVKMNVPDALELNADKIKIAVEVIKKTKASHSNLRALNFGIPEIIDIIRVSEDINPRPKYKDNDYISGYKYDNLQKHDGNSIHNSGISDAMDLLKVSSQSKDSISGSITYMPLFLYNGGGVKFVHNGKKVRDPRIYYNGSNIHNETRKVNTYGYCLITHNGKRERNFGYKHDGILRSGIKDDLVIRVFDSYELAEEDFNA